MVMFHSYLSLPERNQSPLGRLRLRPQMTSSGDFTAALVMGVRVMLGPDGFVGLGAGWCLRMDILDEFLGSKPSYTKNITKEHDSTASFEAS